MSECPSSPRDLTEWPLSDAKGPSYFLSARAHHFLNIAGSTPDRFWSLGSAGCLRSGELSIAATVDVSGPLTEPVFRPLTRSLATSAVRGVLSNALRPADVLLRPLRGSRETTDGGCELPEGSAPK